MFNIFSFLEPNHHTVDYLRLVESRLEAEQWATTEKIAATLDGLQEALLWEDNFHSESKLFSYFMLKSKIPLHLLRISKTHPDVVLSFLNVLTEGIKRRENLSLFLSRNFLNTLVSSYNDSVSEDTLHLMVSLVKSVSGRITVSNAYLLYSQSRIDYPILTFAFRLEEHADVLVRIGARVIILNLLKLDEAEIIRIVQERNYFAINIGRICNDLLSVTPANASDFFGLFLDTIDYWNDLFGLQLPAVTTFLSNSILDLLVIPVLIKNLSATDLHQDVAVLSLHLMVSQLKVGPIVDLIVDMVSQNSHVLGGMLGSTSALKHFASLCLVYSAVTSSHEASHQLWTQGLEKNGPGQLISLLNGTNSPLVLEIICRLLGRMDAGVHESALQKMEMEWRARLLGLVLEYASLLREIVAEHGGFWDMNVEKHLISPSVLALFFKQTPLAYDAIEKEEKVLVTFKVWQHALSLAKKDWTLAIPPRITELDSIDMGSFDSTEMFPCLVQISKNSKVLPPERLFVIFYDCLFLLVKPDPLVLGKGVLLQQHEILDLAAGLNHDFLYTIDMCATKTEFGPVMVHAFSKAPRVVNTPVARLFF
ncbi:hypothetical protein HDV03_001877 [Kappamyces sp. JEL0829]|nr:hypothetical protein HDV03_001877 [Kappamyces sp. JEL0829]